ncbi:hypothetical protein FOXB_16392 [Fusarium oxysporum f. sp. conglutinans Fo5176]|uniref:Prion-inhibition and propagation HeLo domain-containing protein n=1 Tax=Fusarium oxysporum (strain Fo5176) TaxID=660025 RepID=F9GCK9_FUSOF|nr:hypothetical protein FOXB_16392 [Fusarium oxysporum f. sp. conglutinans Fo5176]
MAEVAGLALGAVGVVGLIGAFKDTIDLFGLLAESRDLGRDYEILRIKLDIQKTLLLQWTDRYGLDEANDQEGTTPLVSVSSISAWRMGVFKTQYDDFKKRIAQGNDKPFRSRALWAVRDKQKFEVLIRDLADLIASLDKLIPVTSKQPALRNLADDDVRSISGLQNLKMLLEASQGTHRLISESAQRIISRACEEIILNRLWFRKIHERRETVADAHLDTLKWALYPPKDEAHWHDLSQWLRQPSTHEVYWISGKAGSGKSTLMNHIKVLVSSRPIPACVAIYQNLPKLKLQDLTRKDIGAYVKDVIGGHPYMKRLLRRSPDGARSVINQLVDKSSGVFLWVVLACRSLLSGFEDCDRLPELQKRVDELPPELEDFFDLMLAKINQRYQYQGAYLLRLCYESQRASRSPGCPALANMDTLALALVDDLDVSANSIAGLSWQDKIDLCTVLEGRLRSRCGGLLETQPAGNKNGQLVGGVVVFMHRTVFEYLSNESVWEQDCLRTDPYGPAVATGLSMRDLYHMILHVAELDKEGKSQRIEAQVISALRSGLFWTQRGDAIGFFEQLPHFLSGLVACKYEPKDPVLSALAKACHELPGTATRNYLHAPLLLAADIGAREYIIRNPEFRTLNGPSIPTCGCPPLIFLEFRPSWFNLNTRSRPSPQSVSVLLRSGANPRLRENVFTPWLLWLQEPSGLTRKDRTDDELLQAMDVAETMVKYDAGGIKDLRKWLSSDEYRNRPIPVTQRGDKLLKFLDEHERMISNLTKDHVFDRSR